MITTRRPIDCARQDVFPAASRAQLGARLTTALDAPDGDELAVLTMIAERLVVGQRRYGRLDLDRDGRNLRREALEDVLDGLFYAAAALLRRDDA